MTTDSIETSEREALPLPRRPLASCYDVNEWPGKGSSQAAALQIVRSALESW